MSEQENCGGSKEADDAADAIAAEEVSGKTVGGSKKKPAKDN